MATLAQKIETEQRMRELLESGGLPQPDYVEYGFTCIRLVFMETKTVVVIDIDEPGDERTRADDDIEASRDERDRAGERKPPRRIGGG